MCAEQVSSESKQLHTGHDYVEIKSLSSRHDAQEGQVKRPAPDRFLPPVFTRISCSGMRLSPTIICAILIDLWWLSQTRQSANAEN